MRNNVISILLSEFISKNRWIRISNTGRNRTQTCKYKSLIMVFLINHIPVNIRFQNKRATDFVAGLQRGILQDTLSDNFCAFRAYIHKYQLVQ